MWITKKAFGWTAVYHYTHAKLLNTTLISLLNGSNSVTSPIYLVVCVYFLCIYTLPDDN